ncbi:MAG TPA: orotidine-5'-phosphate decarboxylase [Phycisphaerae bacterium]|nr:orotidine-5'-phosphate decarboxylase [Phycisphaerae bacterium]HOM50343.1 orotidine-5'-phosphate decarboxylase [Phycisphaerae bacterium]HON67668.1 orotidine-5'-phosphate decarboxylase [Phycisphaerae bacterium]HOQ84970.1 orotidine-5'-phosphate decarboxylase [Phycisphaerae bacterium]HPP27252.1 orotidine-5'-phosphate decarboxylase [Phycisphaerae bacterium]
MPENFADRLIAATHLKHSPSCVGIDPDYSKLPASISGHREMNDPSDSEAALDAILEFSRRVLKIVAPFVPAVKINTAFFERYYSQGVEGYYELIQDAAKLNLVVIGDCKRGDVGNTSEMYARSALSDPDFSNLDDMVGPDAVTVNGWAGLDGVKPFIDVAREEQKGIFVWVRASNPSAAAIQEAKLENGDTVCEHLARQVASWAAGDGLIGRSGYSAVGAVVAAKDHQATARMRELMPHCVFLIPGYGAQGGTAADIVPAFKPDGTGALVTASRSVIYAFNDPKYASQFPNQWEKCVEQACRDFVADVAAAIKK